MQRKAIKYIAAGIVLIVVAYNSVYFKSLSEVKAASIAGTFDAHSYAQQFWREKLIPGLSKAVELSQLITQLQTNKENAFKAHSHALGIGNIRYFLIKGEGNITAIGENDLSVVIQPDSSQRTIKIAIEFIYGNAVRDALGVINMTEFSNTMDLNNISEEINKKIRTEVLPPFKARIQKGKTVQFTGAIELNQRYLNLDEMEVIPITVSLVE
jgi:predicted lipoprotein